jgi:enoyl-CoA hydratase/carnithine racemase
MGKNSIEIENDIFSCKQTDDVAFVTFKQNPMEILANNEFKNAFISAFSKIDDSRKIKGIVITNSPEYIGGNYLKLESIISNIVVTLKDERRRAAIQRLKNSTEQLVNLFINITKPTIAALNGDIGETVFGISLACDFRYAASNTIFHHHTVKLGLPTDGVLAYYLVKYIGLPRSIDILLTKTSLSAPEVHDLGLLTDVTADEELMSRCVEKLNEISRYPSHSVSAVKRLFRPDENEIHLYIDRAFETIVLNLDEIKETLSDRK